MNRYFLVPSNPLLWDAGRAAPLLTEHADASANRAVNAAATAAGFPTLRRWSAYQVPGSTDWLLIVDDNPGVDGPALDALEQLPGVTALPDVYSPMPPQLGAQLVQAFGAVGYQPTEGTAALLNRLRRAGHPVPLPHHAV